MFSLPMKAGYYHMVIRGRKKEVYREIKPYYTIRFKKLFKCESLSHGDFITLLDETNDERFTSQMILKSGYDKECPAALIDFTLTIGEGNPDWGAEPGTRYYVIKINKLTELIGIKKKT